MSFFGGSDSPCHSVVIEHVDTYNSQHLILTANDLTTTTNKNIALWKESGPLPVRLWHRRYDKRWLWTGSEHRSLFTTADNIYNSWQHRWKDDSHAWFTTAVVWCPVDHEDVLIFAQCHPKGSETTPPYAPRSSTFGSEPPSVEDDVDEWRYSIVRVACQKRRWRRPSTLPACRTAVNQSSKSNIYITLVHERIRHCTAQRPPTSNVLHATTACCQFDHRLIISYGNSIIGYEINWDSYP